MYVDKDTLCDNNQGSRIRTLHEDGHTGLLPVVANCKELLPLVANCKDLLPLVANCTELLPLVANCKDYRGPQMACHKWSSTVFHPTLLVNITTV